MKKLLLLVLVTTVLSVSSFAQGIDDRAVIPVAVTLNSILRLNVTSGGNIEFNFNTLEEYQNGIFTSAAYQTKFNVASSVNWEVNMYSENTELIGTDDAAGSNTLTLDNIGYHITSDGGFNDLNFTSNDPGAPVPLNNIAGTILVGYDGSNSNAGDINQNNFTIHWRCGTAEGTMNGASILSQGIAADRYATNVFLILQPVNP